MTIGREERSLLFVLAHGVGEHELAALRTALGPDDIAPAAGMQVPDHAVDVLLRSLDASTTLRDLGVVVDRSNLVLRPRGRDDGTAALAIERRPTGPAAVTLFASTDVLTRAARGGPSAALEAARDLGALLARLRGRLRRGDPTETWFVGLGSPEAVRTTFDLETAWQERIVAGLAEETSLRLADGVAFVAAANRRAMELAFSRMRRPPFATHGTPIETGPAQFVLRARPGVAFGRERVAARAVHAADAAAVFAAPCGDSVRARGSSFDELLARFWMRAATLHAECADEVSMPVRGEPGTVATPTANVDAGTVTRT